MKQTQYSSPHELAHNKSWYEVLHKDSGRHNTKNENLYLKNTEYATNWQGDTSLINYV